MSLHLLKVCKDKVYFQRQIKTFCLIQKIGLRLEEIFCVLQQSCGVEGGLKAGSGHFNHLFWSDERVLTFSVLHRIVI